MLSALAAPASAPKRPTSRSVSRSTCSTAITRRSRSDARCRRNPRSPRRSDEKKESWKLGLDVTVDFGIERQQGRPLLPTRLPMPLPSGSEHPQKEHRDQIIAQTPSPRLFHHLRGGDLADRFGPGREGTLIIGRQSILTGPRADGYGARVHDGEHAEVVDSPKRHREPNLAKGIAPLGRSKRNHRVVRPDHAETQTTDASARVTRGKVAGDRHRLVPSTAIARTLPLWKT